MLLKEIPQILCTYIVCLHKASFISNGFHIRDYCPFKQFLLVAVAELQLQRPALILLQETSLYTQDIISLSGFTYRNATQISIKLMCCYMFST